MIASIASAEVLGARIALQLPPCGTPGRILKARLHRHFHRRRDSGLGSSSRRASTLSAAPASCALDRSQPPIYDRPSYSAAPDSFVPYQLDDDAALLLRQLYRHASAIAATPTSEQDTLAASRTSVRLEGELQHLSSPQPTIPDIPSYYPVPGEPYPILRHKLLRLLQAQQPRALLSFLAAALGTSSSSAHHPGVVDAVDRHVVAQLLADLPAATFSELLRTLDPVAAAASSDVEPSMDEPAGDVELPFPPTWRSLDRRQWRTRPLGQAGYALDATAGLSLDASLPLLHHPLASAVDDFGVRAVYRVLLEVVLEAVRARGIGISSSGGRNAVVPARSRHPGGPEASLLQKLTSPGGAYAAQHSVLTTADAKVLLRVAGASQTPHLATAIWHRLVLPLGPDADAYAEYVAARFLTRPLYYQHDRTRVMVGPRQLWHQLSGDGAGPGWRKVVQHQRAVRDQRGLSLWGTALWNGSAGKGAAASGSGESELKEESVWPVGWEPDPERVANELRSLLDHAAAKGQVNEELLCALMVAETRVGGTEIIERVMREYWNIAIVFDAASGGLEVEVFDEESDLAFAPDSPLGPTVKLLEALVETFCRRSEVAAAIKVVDFTSKMYDIPIPSSVWHSLLEWSWVLSSSSSWRRLGATAKVVSPESIRWIWDTMRAQLVEDDADPSAVLPADELQLLARHLAKFGTGSPQDQGELFAVLDSMLRQNEAQRREAVELTDDLKHAVRAGIDVAVLLTRQQKALADFYLTAWWIRKACRFVLANTTSNDDALAATADFVPAFVERYRGYLNMRLTYKVAAGRVALGDDGRGEVDVGYLSGEVTAEDEPGFRQFVHWSPLDREASRGAIPVSVVEPGAAHLLSAKAGEAVRRVHRLEQRARLMEKMKYYGL